MIDQRQHIRFAIELDATVETDKAPPLTGRTHDLSKGGLCMLTSGTLPIGTPCRVKIALVFSQTEFSEHMTLPATIVWCTKMQTAFQLGVKFAQLDAQARGYLDMFIKFLEGGADEGGEEEKAPNSIDPDGD